MEKKKLPNSTLILILGILSILSFCCYGVFGLNYGIIAIILARTATKMYNENPDLYTGYGNVRTGKILAIIGTIISALMIIFIIVIIIFYGGEGLLDGLEQFQREAELQQQAQ